MKRKRDTRQELQKEQDSVPGIPAHVLRFMNSLPMAQEPMDWITAFRTALKKFLVDVDRVGIFVNINCDLLNIKAWSDRGKNRVLFIMNSISDEQPADADFNASIADDKRLIEFYLEHLRRQGFPFNGYHPPYSLLYSIHGDAHLGIIILFRQRGAPPISTRTLETMKHLRPFFCFMLSDLVARHAHFQPDNVSFHRIIESLMPGLNLTAREREVFTLRIMGDQKKAIADKLFLSQETISKHIQKILRKGKARNFIELFMRYYVPELEDLNDPRFGTIHDLNPSSLKRKENTKEEFPQQPMSAVLIW